MLIHAKITPNAKKPAIKQINENNFEIRVDAPPEAGRANARLIELLSAHFEIPKSRIRIIKGHKSRAKIIQIESDL